MLLHVEPEESYYLLCDALPEDKNLRVRLQQEKLVGAGRTTVSLSHTHITSLILTTHRPLCSPSGHSDITNYGHVSAFLTVHYTVVLLQYQHNGYTIIKIIVQ